jgi:hypothetical protein
MATYTPATLRYPTNITASDVAVYTASGGFVMRTFSFNTLTSHNVYLNVTSAGAADATTNRILDNFALAASVPYIQNGWWTGVNTDTIRVHADSIATNAPVFGAWGYTYV